MDKPSLRRKSYKASPSTLSDGPSSQQSRRDQALQEQKRKRLQRVDSSRQLDLFADLNLGLSDDDELEGNDQREGPEVVREGVAQFASLLMLSATQPITPASSAGAQGEEPQSAQKKGRTGKRGGGKGRGKRKPSKWADKCMYAELLEMQDDQPWGTGYGTEGQPNDGLPDDLETGWVALAPVPVGKRCLAVTQQSAGMAGVAPNTMLRSRVLGKAIISPFPSPIPPCTILDCILDQNWRVNGIVHVLDVIRWKGQDVGDCEAGFRFWWRDTRLSELSAFPPPASTSTNKTPSQHQAAESEPSQSTAYIFSYPTSFIPIPYLSSTAYTDLISDVIPRARSSRSVRVSIPDPTPPPHDTRTSDGDEMQLDDHPGFPSLNFSWSLKVTQVDVDIRPDGLLLYVAQASYEPGTSPLSTWVPIVAYDAGQYAVMDVGASAATVSASKDREGPLALFERLVQGRLHAKELHAGIGQPPDVSMEI